MAKDESKPNLDDKENGTLAAASLKPAAKAVDDPKSKMQMMSDMMSVMGGMSKSDLVNFFNQSMAQIGHEADKIPSGAASKNAASIKMKPSAASSSMKEDIDEMFSGEELTEEFKEKATVIFEAAVNAKVMTEVARLEEEFETKLNEEVAVFAEEVTEKLDTYLDYVVENWMSENEVAIESSLRNEIAEQFIDGLKNLFVENYMSVPEEKVDVIEDLTDKITELETKLDESISENRDLKGVLTESLKKEILNDMSSDLSLTQKDKFATLSEGVEFDGDFDDYTKKLEIIKENYFKVEQTVYSSNIEEETFELEEETHKPISSDPNVDRYVKALQRTVKR